MTAPPLPVTTLGKSKKTVKTIVLGGLPPASAEEGFGEWAKTVAERPMPVQYKLRPLSAVYDTVDEASYDFMVGRYVR